MGDPITDHYWIVDGNIVRDEDTLVASSDLSGKSAVYYVENRCGSTTSIDSHAMLSCDDKSLSTEDSLFYLDGDTLALEMLRLNDIYAEDSLVFDVHRRLNPDDVSIVATPGNPARIWLGESVRLDVQTNQPYRYLVWRKVTRKYDMRDYDVMNDKDFIYTPEGKEKEDEIIDYSGRPYFVDEPQDTTFYYATLSDGICPETSTPVMEVDVLAHIPTAFTPHDKDGLNDVFMEGHEVIIFDRYGDKLFEGKNGWPGTRLGKMVEPAVYFYDVKMRDGSWMKGTIEVVKF
jgi:gliding motility-associated-like protein